MEEVVRHSPAELVEHNNYCYDRFKFTRVGGVCDYSKALIINIIII